MEPIASTELDQIRQAITRNTLLIDDVSFLRAIVALQQAYFQQREAVVLPDITPPPSPARRLARVVATVFFLLPSLVGAL